jgi:flagellar protein FlaG
VKIDRVSSSGAAQSTENMADSAELNKEKYVTEINFSQLNKAVDVLNKKAEQEENYDVRFAMYKDTNRVIVQVVDKITNKVISTFPPEQILKMAEMVDQEFKVIDKKI